MTIAMLLFNTLQSGKRHIEFQHAPPLHKRIWSNLVSGLTVGTVAGVALGLGLQQVVSLSRRH